MYLSIIIPMYNEAAGAAACVRALAGAMETADLPGNYEILFSDDGSSDGCGDIVRETARELSRELSLTRGEIRVVRSEQNRGKGHAVRLGMQASAGDICVFTDCDLAYGTDVILRMAERMNGESGTDVLIGSRVLDGLVDHGDPFHKEARASPRRGGAAALVMPVDCVWYRFSRPPTGKTGYTPACGRG
jgi:dolichyl-phosphate beta-glucosyltransferase